MVRVVYFTPESKGLLFNKLMALIASVLVVPSGFKVGLAVVTESPSLVPHKSQLGELLCAMLTAETVRVPVGVHRLYYPSNNELITFATTWGKEDVEVVLTVLAPFKFIEGAIGERPEALCTDKTLGVPQLSS